VKVQGIRVKIQTIRAEVHGIAAEVHGSSVSTLACANEGQILRGTSHRAAGTPQRICASEQENARWNHSTVVSRDGRPERILLRREFGGSGVGNGYGGGRRGSVFAPDPVSGSDSSHHRRRHRRAPRRTGAAVTHDVGARVARVIVPGLGVRE
jgi:hypothetical protein